jgi:hypothetical protein
VAVCLLGAGLAGQAPPGVLTTTLASIEHYPTFYHGRTISLVGTPSLVGDLWRLPRTDSGAFVLLPRTGSPPMRPVEVRGQLFDVGRLDAEDSRLSATGIRQVVKALFDDRWPTRGELLVLAAATWTDDLPGEATLRSLALHPDAFDGKPVTIRGRFRGQNLYGDLPAWPRKSQWDFVLQSADAAVWITGLRPRGRGFDLNPRQRLGSRTWLQITGTVHVVDTLPTVEATQVALTEPVEEPPPPVEPETLLKPEPPSVVFSAPLNGDIDVDRDAPVRVQFSQDMNASTFAGAVHITYPTATGTEFPAFEVKYQALTRSIEVRFEHPLAGGAMVRVELSGGIQAVDGQALAPITITFTTKISDGR